jgi:hypothetical protein
VDTVSQTERSAPPADLPDLLTFADGRRVAMPAEWPARRAELLKLLQDLQYGHLPPALPVDACRLYASTFGDQRSMTVTQDRLALGEQGPSLLVTVYRRAASLRQRRLVGFAGPASVVVGTSPLATAARPRTPDPIPYAFSATMMSW